MYINWVFLYCLPLQTGGVPVHVSFSLHVRIRSPLTCLWRLLSKQERLTTPPGELSRLIILVFGTLSLGHPIASCQKNPKSMVFKINTLQIYICKSHWRYLYTEALSHSNYHFQHMSVGDRHLRIYIQQCMCMIQVLHKRYRDATCLCSL